MKNEGIRNETMPIYTHFLKEHVTLYVAEGI